jgi:MFS family permease
VNPRARLVSLVTADILSALGSSVSIVAIPWLVLVSTGSAARMGVVAAAEMVPYLLSSLLGPPLADRVGLRRTSVLTDAGSAVVMAVVAAAPALDFGALLVLVAVVGGMRGIGDRVKHAMIRPVAQAAGAELIRVTSAYDGLSRGAMLLGAPLGGLLIFWFGVRGAIWLDAASFLACAAIVGLLVRLPRPAQTGAAATGAAPAREGYLAALRAGFSYLRHDRVLLTMFGVVFALNVFSNASTAVFVPLWVADVLRSPAGLGLILGAFSAGALLGNVTFTVLGPRVPRHLAFVVGAAVSGAPRLFALGVSDDLPVVLAVAFGSGIGIAAVNPILGVALYERVPVDLQTRVIGIAGAVAFAGLPLGALLAGWAATEFGLRPALLGAAAVCLAVTLIPLLTPRPADQPTHRRPEPEPASPGA